MTSLHDAIGKPAIVRDSAEQLGSASFFAVDAADRRVTVLAIAAGRSTRLVDWSEIQNIGPDAIIINSSREPTGEDDRAVGGAMNPLGKRALSDLGNELGSVTDVEVDDDGVVQIIAIADVRIEGSRLEGVGSYAVVVTADPREA